MIPVAEHIRALIFDCDGTLADNMSLHMTAWRDTFIALGEDFPREFVDRLKGTPAKKIIELYNHEYNRHIDAEAFAEDKHRRARTLLLNSKPIMPVVAVVRKYSGVLPMAVASGSTRENVQITLTAIGAADCFDTIITSEDRVDPKPSPDIFLEAARRMQVNPSLCQVFEDGDVGLEAARRAGMEATDVRSYLESSRESPPR